MRRGRFLLLSGAFLLTGACVLINGNQTSNNGGAAGPDGACAGVVVPESPWLVGMSGDQRVRLEKEAKDGIVVVRYEGANCVVDFEVLENCAAAGRYVYESDPERTDVRVVGASTLLATLPVAAPELSEQLGSDGLRLDVRRVGHLRAPSSLRIDRGGLSGAGCERATHVVSKIGLGGYAITKGSNDQLDERKGLFSKAGQSVDHTALIGDPNACARAVRREKRTAECDIPLSASFVPITNEVVLTALVAIEKSKGLSAFEIDRHEVTAGAYAGCVAAKKCTAAVSADRCTAAGLGKEEHPINCVTWAQANDYCTFKGQRLPTEKEWAHAAGTKKFPWGNTWPPPEGVANLADETARSRAPHWEVIKSYVDGFADTAPVGSLQASPSGMADAAGNVMEWTSDWYDRREKARVVRGSSFGQAARNQIELGARAFYVPETVSVHIGFRCATAGP